MEKLVTMKEMVEKIELTDTQRKRAETLYENICKAVEISGVKVKFYSQGSFASRTVVRPFDKGEDQAFDVDVIYEVQDDKILYEPAEFKKIIRNAIESTQYWEKTTEHNMCFTVEYAEQDGVGFSIDLIPALPEDDKTKTKLIPITEQSHLMDTAIAIPCAGETENEWITNNPKGYIDWFDRKLDIFNVNYREAYRDGEITASIDDLPEDDGSNSLRTVIKFLKRNRDVYFAEIDSDDKPLSIIITTIVAELAEHLVPTNNGVDLLYQVLEQLSFLSPKSEEYNYSAAFTPTIENIVSRENNIWELYNPANGEDNLLDSWNDDPKKQKEFFEWVRHLTKFYESLNRRENNENIMNEYNNILNIPSETTEKSDFEVTKKSPKPYGQEGN